MKFFIKKKESLPTEIRRIAEEQLHVAVKQTSGRKVSATSIHSARKAIKRTRAVLQLLRCSGNEPAVRDEDHALRDAGRLLAAERDLHVQWIALKRLSICKHDGVCRALHERLQSAQQKQDSQSADHIKQFNAAILSVQNHLATWPTIAVDRKQLALALKRSYRRTRRCFKTVCEAPVGAKFHDWRKAAKSFWHHLELTDSLAPKKLRKFSKNARDLAGYLGEEHDLYLLLTELADAHDPDTRAVKREIRKMRSELQDRAFKIARQTFDLAPSAFHERVSRWFNQAKN
jgi:CHAD domain-containing protein